MYDDGYVFDELKVENYDLIIPTFDYDEEDPDKNYGHDPDMRDYREYLRRMHGTSETRWSEQIITIYPKEYVKQQSIWNYS